MILIIDFGSQFNQLIARRVRENKVFCQIMPPNTSIRKIRKLNPEGIILSGGPSSIYEKNSPKADKSIFDLNIPILGICYGAQLMIQELGGTVEKATKREFGKAELTVTYTAGLFAGLETGTMKHQVWMSHGDRVETIPAGFEATAISDNSPYAALRHKDKPFVAVQFHPEKSQSVGRTVLENFAHLTVSQ